MTGICLRCVCVTECVCFAPLFIMVFGSVPELFIYIYVYFTAGRLFFFMFMYACSTMALFYSIFLKCQTVNIDNVRGTAKAVFYIINAFTSSIQNTKQRQREKSYLAFKVP